MNNKALVSIIVPIYNMEQYLPDFLESLCQQSYSDLEIILVNDGSTDSSLNICNDHAKRNSRIRIFTQENAGVASARNFGLSVSTGEYIIHADPDDLLPSDAIENLLISLLKNNADICIGNYYIKYPRKTIKKNVKKTFRKNELIKDLALGNMHGSLWNKLIRRSVISDINFIPGVNYMEDKIFLINLILKAPKIKINYVNSIVYIYNQRSGSYTNSDKYIDNLKHSTDIILKISSPLLSEKELITIHNKLRIAIILSSEKPKKSLSFQDSLIIKDKRVGFHFRFAIFFLIKGWVFPLKFLKYLRKTRIKILGLY